MKRFLILLYGVVSYGIFFSWFLYLVGFLADTVVPKTVNSGDTIPAFMAILVNTFLVALFGIQHSVMARQGFKQWITKYIPQAMERSTYVLVASVLFFGILAFWQPIPLTIWKVESTIGQYIIFGFYFLGWGILLLSTFLIDHFELFGLKQVFFNLRNKAIVNKTFVTPLLYKLCRHPMMLGVIIAVWSTPHMTVGHLLFAGLMTGYIFAGTHYEEKDLVRELGGRYELYQQEMPKFMPTGRRSSQKNIEAVTK